MTYCVGLRLHAGLVLLADTRTNAGVDNIARFRKLHVFERSSERAACLLTAGNLSVTQSVIARIESQIEAGRHDPSSPSILNSATLYDAALLIGEAMRDVLSRDRGAIEAQGAAADATLLFGGQRLGGELRLFQIYPAGNFIEATDDTPFLQIGEHKYGKPILDRVIRPDTTLSEAVKAVLVSMDSTLRSNLSVGMPLDLCVIRAGELKPRQLRIEADHAGYRQISDRWASSLREAFHQLPDIDV